jgi:hypothetical protein
MNIKPHRKLNELTDEEVLKVCEVLNGEVKNITIERDSNFIEVKYFDEDIDAKIQVSIRTDYQHRSSEKDLVTEYVSYYDEKLRSFDIERIEYLKVKSPTQDTKEFIELLKERIDTNNYYEPSDHHIGQGRLLEVIEYLQSINIEL